MKKDRRSSSVILCLQPLFTCKEYPLYRILFSFIEAVCWELTLMYNLPIIKLIFFVRFGGELIYASCHPYFMEKEDRRRQFPLQRGRNYIFTLSIVLLVTMSRICMEELLSGLKPSRAFHFTQHLSNHILFSLDSMIAVNTVPTTPYKDQKPGTSGLRKKTPIFMEGHYLHNFIQVSY